MRPQLVIGGIVALLVLGGAVYVLGGDRAEVADGDGPAAKSDRAGKGRRARRTAGGRAGGRGGGRASEAAAPDLEARVAKLEREVVTLRRQLALPAARRAVFSNDSDSDSADLDSPQLDSTVRDIVADERQRQRTQRSERRTRRAMERLADAGGLNDEQQTAITALWDTERERIGPLFTEARSGERDFDEVIKDVQAIRDETDTEARSVLADTQFEAYEEHRPRGPGGRGRRGGGGRNGGGGNGGGGADAAAQPAGR